MVFPPGEGELVIRSVVGAGDLGPCDAGLGLVHEQVPGWRQPCDRRATEEVDLDDVQWTYYFCRRHCEGLDALGVLG